MVQESEAPMQQVELLSLHREQEREVLTAQAEHAKEELSRCVCKHSLALCSAGSLHTVWGGGSEIVLFFKSCILLFPQVPGNR